ncbi:hypothetical protein [Thiomicrorhabdus sp. 6S3-12]|uniref:hypothetical protein n=1 Tax=Thiomicrorhabdus sp. 6S3-12 TaxID=2819681 RepID=UPI001AADAA64|nr:hypothetical protein [Thiomicrorhabdus sp. 6S3-12]MBO1923202.1 hypothetical protein [Thiomicrorhabdus sp. 6S3-12]
MFFRSMVAVGLLAISHLAFSGTWYDPKLPFKEAVVTYQIQGTMSGTKTVYVREYGRKSAEYSDLSMSIFGMKQQQKEIVITEPEWIYTFDMVNRSAVKTSNPTKIFKQELEKYTAEEQAKIAENAGKNGVYLLKGMQGTVQRDILTLHGYRCDMTSATGVKVFTISGTGFPLKTISQIMGVTSVEEAVEVRQENPPEERFEKPKGIEVHYDPAIDQMMRDQIKRTLKNLLLGVPLESKARHEQKMLSAEHKALN